MDAHLTDHGYRRVPGFLPPARAQALAAELRAAVARDGARFDQQVPASPCSYNFPPFVRLLVEKIPEVGALCGEPLLPTYAYARLYRRGAVLPRHVDRDACEISLTVHLDGDQPWDFWLQRYGLPAVCQRLAPGDALLYLGCQTDHWRDAYAGEDYAQMFLHYVLARGTRAHAVFDRQQAPVPRDNRAAA